ncbi:MAG: 3'(2'),5'-bisphosphate nucleotidase CysQ [Candidatus Marinimicrobia bacterium]|nr:3'(2'),5'-bisphosphate nucleotidase CysQ [Candidatus Neomarinimicrobiota bacterium]|tara:strand:- start:10041 stop:10835 length:795 start_codon:yes stop_codon:yes gene_type:complete
MQYELDVAINAALKAGEILLDYYYRNYDVKDKGTSPMYSGLNPVTDADRASDNYLREILTSEFPQYGWFSEETKDSPDRLYKDRVWIVDPLDGTKEYIDKIPMWVVSIALVENKEPILGVLYNPEKEEIFTAVTGKGAFYNGKSVTCSKLTELSKMIILNSRTETRDGLWLPFKEVFKELKGVGSVAYKLGLTAAAKADIFATLRPKNEWDVCAGHCIINEAGGMMIDLKGNEVTYNNKNPLFSPGLVAGNPMVVKKVLRLLTL